MFAGRPIITFLLAATASHATPHALERGLLNDGALFSYAFGLELGDYRELPLVDYNGVTGGYRTGMIRFPSAHTSVVTMWNDSDVRAVRRRMPWRTSFSERSFRRRFPPGQPARRPSKLLQ